MLTTISGRITVSALIDRIKELCARHDVPVFGIADSARLEDADQGCRPTDLLPRSQSVICLGIPVPKGVFACGERTNETYWRAANIYYRAMDALLMHIARVVEADGAIAVPVYGCFPYDVRGPGDFVGYVSLVKMADAVGIGTISKNGLLFNGQYGPRLILGGLVTTASLPEIVWPHREQAGCPENCCVCQDACPIGAIAKSGKVDRVACVKHSMRSPLFSYFMKTKAFDVSDAGMINLVTGVDDHSMYTCTKCVSACPYP